MALNERKYFINGEALVSIQTKPTSPGQSESVETTTLKYAFELSVGDVVVTGGNQQTVAEVILEGTGTVFVTFTDGQTVQYNAATQVITVVSLAMATGDGADDGLFELGLSVDPIIVQPKLIHKDMHTDDFGPEAPADVMWYLGTATVTMNLIHFSMTVLDFCLAEAMGGQVNNEVWAGGPGGLAPAGTPLGGGKALYTEGCHYVGLIIKSPKANFPWNFPAAYLEDSVEYPLGTDRSAVRLRWKVIPYVDSTGTQGPRGEWLKSENAILWTHPNDDASGQTVAAGRNNN